MANSGAYGACAMPGNYADPMGGMANMGGIDRAGVPLKSPFTRRARPTNLAAFVVCIFLPFLVFTSVYSLQSFSLHYTDADTCKLLSFLVGLFVALLGWFALKAWLRREDSAQDPKWYSFLFVTGALAWVFAMVFGNKNFLTNMSPYYDIINLNVYNNIDPANYRGQQLMDAGRIIFSQGSHLELSKSMGFRNLDTYCVAPVVSGGNKTAKAASSEQPEFDFWAVGINCCSGHTPDFHCGEFNSLNARSGLRLMRDDQRAFFRLAVQQAEAAYNIRAPHPIFMYWMLDPSSEVNAYQDDAYKFWLIGVGAFFGAQLLMVILATVAFAKLGV